jgi:hypothetical protein
MQSTPGPALTRAVAEGVRRGWRVEQLTPTTAVLMQRGPNHVVHGVATLLTGGLWLPIWLIVSYAQRERRLVLAVDADGKVYKASGT